MSIDDRGHDAHPNDCIRQIEEPRKIEPHEWLEIGFATTTLGET